MDEGLTAEMIGARIAVVAQMAVRMHLAMDDAEAISPLPTAQQAMIGGTDRRVTDDPLSAVTGRE